MDLVFHWSLRSHKIYLCSNGEVTVKKEIGSKRGGRNSAKANEASLTVANWCFNLCLRLSRCVSLQGGRLMGIRARQTFCLLEIHIHLLCDAYLSSAALTGTSQTLLNSTKSMLKLGNGEQRWVGKYLSQKEAEAGERGQREGKGLEVRECLVSKVWVCIIIPSWWGQHLIKCKWRSRLQIDF